MSSLRFCMVTTFYPPHNFGGDGIAIRRLSRALVRRGHHVTVVHDRDAYSLLHDGPEPEPGPEPEGLEVHRLRSRWGPVAPLLTHQMGRPVVHGRRIREILDRGRFDVIHFHNVSLVGGPGVLAAGSGVKLYEAHEHWLVCPTHVLWRHDREVCTGRECLRCVLRHRRPPQLWRYTGQLERQLRHVDAFIAKSEFSRDKHHEFGFTREMRVVPYFLPDRTEAEVSGDSSPRPHPRPYFLFVGRLEKIKGLQEIIPAFRRFRDADLLVAGDGEYAAELKALAGDVPSVRFLGRVDPERLRSYYRHALACVVPSICFETFGIIIIEAFRQGTPVIARRIGPFPEIVEACGGGLLFEDLDGFVDALRRIHGQEDLRNRLGVAASRGFAERWSESAVLPRYLELVAEVRERARTGPDREAGDMSALARIS